MTKRIPKFRSGAAVDSRPEEAKLKDFKVEEIVAAFNPVNWVEKPQDQWRKFPIFNQDGSGSCVAQTEAKELGIMRWLKDKIYIHFSATDIYQRRTNKPASGMNAVDARSIAAKGVTLEDLAPSQGMSDAKMDAAVIEAYKREVGAVFAVPNYVALPTRDIDAIASVIQTTGKGVMVWFYFEYPEWSERPVVGNASLELLNATARHSVTAVDFFLLNGKKCLLIEDSWGVATGIGGQRVVDEVFFKARNWYAGYLVNFRFDDQSQPSPLPQPQPLPNPTPGKPKHTFVGILTFGETNDHIGALQDILKYEGLFPVNTASTGYYGALTARAVLQWQKKWAVAPVEELDSLAGRRVGEKTIAKLNEIYA